MAALFSTVGCPIFPNYGHLQGSYSALWADWALLPCSSDSRLFGALNRHFSSTLGLPCRRDESCQTKKNHAYSAMGVYRSIHVYSARHHVYSARNHVYSANQSRLFGHPGESIWRSWQISQKHSFYIGFARFPGPRFAIRAPLGRHTPSKT